MNAGIKVISYVLDYIHSVPASSWEALGVLLGSSALVTGIIAWINHRRLKNDLERLSRHMVNVLVIVLSSVVSFTGWIVLNGATFANFLGPWATNAIKIIGISTVIYNFAKPSLQWFKDRQANKPISNVNMPDLAAVAATEASPTPTVQPANSFGTASAGVDVTPPPANLFN